MTPKVVAVQPGQMAGMVTRSMVAAFAYAGQFIVPFICLLGALVSFMRRRKRQNLVGVVAQAKSADALNGMSWSEFEMLVGEAFRLQGYQVTEQGGAGADGGVDLVLRRGSETFLVQCKQWKAFKVGVDVVRELYGVMAANGAAGGFVITSGSFTADAQAFANGRNVKLVDGPKLFGLIQQAKASVPARNAAVPKAAPAADYSSILSILSRVSVVDGAQDSQKGSQCRLPVLGLLRLPCLSWHALTDAFHETLNASRTVRFSPFLPGRATRVQVPIQKVRWRSPMNPCLAAQVVDTTPTQGLDKSSGKSMKGADVPKERAQQGDGRSFRPLLGESQAEYEKRRRRFKLPPDDRLECSSLDGRMAGQEADVRNADKGAAMRAEAALFDSRKRYRELRC